MCPVKPSPFQCRQYFCPFDRLALPEEFSAPEEFIDLFLLAGHSYRDVRVFIVAVEIQQNKTQMGLETIFNGPCPDRLPDGPCWFCGSGHGRSGVGMAGILGNFYSRCFDLDLLAGIPDSDSSSWQVSGLVEKKAVGGGRPWMRVHFSGVLYA